MRRSRRRAQTTLIAPPPPDGRHTGRTLAYQPLTDQDIDLIIKTAIELVESSGVIFEPGSEADDLLAAAGCEMGEDGLVKIPQGVTRQ